MTLKYKEEIIRTVDYVDFGNYVKKTLGWAKYCFVENQVCCNDSQHRFDMKKVGETPSKSDIKDILTGKETGKSNPYILFEYLVREKHLEPAIYVVDVCW